MSWTISPREGVDYVKLGVLVIDFIDMIKSQIRGVDQIIHVVAIFMPVNKMYMANVLSQWEWAAFCGFVAFWDHDLI